jgi:hypothetical protein
METDRTTISVLQQEVTQLKHKLRIRSQLVSTLQQKASTSKGGLDLAQLYTQLEDLSIEAADLRRANTDLASENALLGKALNKLKDQQSGYSQKELQDALLDASDELERGKRTIEELKADIEAKDKQIHELERLLQAASSDTKKALETHSGREKTEEQAWKKRYLKEVQTTFNLQAAQAALAEENRCHVEFISVLEGKLEAMETNRARGFNQSLSSLHQLRFKTAQEALDRCRNSPLLQEQTAAAVLRTELICERDVNEELRLELQRTASQSEELRSALAVSRSNLLQSTLRLEAEASRVKALEDMRLADLRTLVRLEA